MSAFFLEHPKETDLALFAGGESGPFARWRIERHVESCTQCQEIAADFFRLPDQLNELADLPNVDWKQMAMAIESGVRADAAGRPAGPSGFLPPFVWQAGLVAATVVVGMVVFQQMNQPQPEPELIAAAKIEAPAPVAEQLTPQAEEMEVAAPEPVRTPTVAQAPVAKATAERQTFASDIAAPAAPPPPPAVVNEAVGRRMEVVAQPVAAEAESAEGRLRNDAAARVGAVSALAVNDQAGGVPAKQPDWVQHSVEAVNFEGAPLSLLSGYSLVAGEAAQTPNVAVSNGSNRMIGSFEFVWIVADGANRAAARVERHDLAMAPGAVTTTGGDQQWRLPSSGASTMQVYLSSATFDDGTTWSPTGAEIAEKGLPTPGGVARLQALGHAF